MSTETVKTPTADVVTDVARSQISDLWKREDYWAIWLGFALIIVGAFIYLGSPPAGFAEKIAKANAVIEVEKNRAPFKTIAYYQAVAEKGKLRGRDSAVAKAISSFIESPQRWSGSPVAAFMMSPQQAEARNAAAKEKSVQAAEKAAKALATAIAAENAAAEAGFNDKQLNQTADNAIEAWLAAQASASSASAATRNKAYNLFPNLIFFMVALMVFFGFGAWFMGVDLKQFAYGFVFLFCVAILAFTLGNESTMRKFGIGSEAWAIILGMLIANTVGTPNIFKQALLTEFYIKTGLVLLGTEVLFDKVVAIGIPGIFVAWVVTPIVLITTYIFGQKVLKIPSRTLNIVISADMSVCGTSAAIATASACRAKKEELTLAIGISLAFTAIMMIVMPAFIKLVGMPPILGGAWMGGTIDATGAVAAAGALLGPKALHVAATIKMIQNVLIGVTAFGVAVYWCAKVECEEGRKVSAMEIWHRFPKFVIGFLAMSIIFSLISASYGTDMSKALLDEGILRGFASPLRGWFFALAFTSIGLATNFRELAPYFKGGKPIILYACGQSFNLVLTLAMAYLMFYVVFPDITSRI